MCAAAAVAASIWNTGVVGAAVAQDRFVLAALLAGLNLFVLRVLLPVKERLDHDGESATAKRSSIARSAWPRWLTENFCSSVASPKVQPNGS